MCKRMAVILMLGAFLMLSYILTGCNNSNDGSEPFVLGACRLDDPDCHLQ